MLFAFILLLLRFGLALAFAFENIEPVTLLSLATVSWSLNLTETSLESPRLLVLARNGTEIETIGNFFLSARSYIFNVTDGNLPPGVFH
ncbi:hypothetical protein B0H10DRAFT_2042789, partial [Mycena sp. CBHHK59/15]